MLCVLPLTAAHADSFGFAAGHGENADMAAASLQVELGHALAVHRRYLLQPGIEFAVLDVIGRGGGQPNNEIGVVQLTPMLRLRVHDGMPVEPVLEVGAGVDTVSGTTINGSRKLSTMLQFGEFVSFGLLFPTATPDSYEISIRAEHISNADIRRPDDGLTFAMVQIAWKFR